MKQFWLSGLTGFLKFSDSPLGFLSVSFSSLQSNSAVLLHKMLEKAAAWKTRQSRRNEREVCCLQLISRRQEKGTSFQISSFRDKGLCLACTTLLSSLQEAKSKEPNYSWVAASYNQVFFVYYFCEDILIWIIGLWNWGKDKGYFPFLSICIVDMAHEVTWYVLE